MKVYHWEYFLGFIQNFSKQIKFIFIHESSELTISSKADNKFLWFFRKFVWRFLKCCMVLTYFLNSHDLTFCWFLMIYHTRMNNTNPFWPPGNLHGIIKKNVTAVFQKRNAIQPWIKWFNHGIYMSFIRYEKFQKSKTLSFFKF